MKLLAPVVSVLVMMWSFATNVLACACCAEPGTYILSTFKPYSYHLGLLNEFTFAPKANLYMTGAGFDTIEGLGPIKREDEATDVSITEDFSLGAAFTNKKAWRFNFTSPKGTAGTLVLPMPAQMVSYKVDIHDEENRPNGPLLYKEFRLKGNVGSGTGFTRAGVVRGTTFFLVFQGRGVGCDEVQDFKNWRLEIDGPKANYSFFGKLTSADKPWS